MNEYNDAIWTAGDLSELAIAFQLAKTRELPERVDLLKELITETAKGRHECETDEKDLERLDQQLKRMAKILMVAVADVHLLQHTQVSLGRRTVKLVAQATFAKLAPHVAVAKARAAIECYRNLPKEIGGYSVHSTDLLPSTKKLFTTTVTEAWAVAPDAEIATEMMQFLIDVEQGAGGPSRDLVTDALKNKDLEVAQTRRQEGLMQLFEAERDEPHPRLGAFLALASRWWRVLDARTMYMLIRICATRKGPRTRAADRATVDAAEGIERLHAFGHSFIDYHTQRSATKAIVIGKIDFLQARVQVRVGLPDKKRATVATYRDTLKGSLVQWAHADRAAMEVQVVGVSADQMLAKEPEISFVISSQS